jgi:HSP20 family molecular chaperone IbpA
MKASQSATQSAPPPPRPSSGCEPVAFHDLTDCLLEAYDAVAQRAYDIFQERGHRSHGQLQDWRRAEQDVLQKLSVDLQESEHAVTALASVPGFSAQRLAVGIESDWMVIHGWSEDLDSQVAHPIPEHKRFGPGPAEWNLEEINRNLIRPARSASRFPGSPNSPRTYSPNASLSPTRSDSHLTPDDLLQYPDPSVPDRQIFAVLKLPAPVDRSRSCAFLHDGLLGIRMLKVQASLRRPLRSGFLKM